MEEVDGEFAPIRKAKAKISSDRIIQDVMVDHTQNSLLKKITLLPIKLQAATITSTRQLGDEAEVKDVEESCSSKRKRTDILSTIRLVTKRSKSQHENLSRKVEPLDPEFTRFKHYLLRHLYQTLPAEETKLFSYLHDAQQEIDRILKQAIVQKESHSSILVGPRGSYKTFLLRHEIALLSQKYDQQFITIKLNGFIHSEQTAINGIATQLEQQLLKLRGRLKNLNETTDISSGSLTEVFEKILRLLDSTSVGQHHNSTPNSATTKITVVFIFDEIDTFAGPVRQTLLYNLFDMVEHARVPVCIFGCTTKLNILEYLEKRVKSRFSQRILYMPQIENLHQFAETVDEMLSVSGSSNYRYTELWNSKVHEMISKENSELYRLIKTNYETFRSIPHFKNSVIPLVFNAKSYGSLCAAIDSCEIIKEFNNNQLESSFTAKVGSLSDLELAILICAARTALKTKDETMNFNLTYAEYEEMIKSLNAKIPTVAKTGKATEGVSVIFDNVIKLWKKTDVKNIWETLIGLNFLTEKAAVGLRESAIAVFYASNYQFQGTTIPFDLRLYQTQVRLQDLRRIVPRSSMYYSWTQL